MISVNGNAANSGDAYLGEAQALMAAFRAGDLRLDAIPDSDPVARQKFLQTFHLSDIGTPLMEAFKTQVDRLVRSDTREAVAIAELANTLARLSPDVAAQALGARMHGMAAHLHSNYADAVASYEQARHYYELAHLPVEKARVERALVDALIYLGRYDEALVVADEARATLTAQNEPRLLAQLETNVGNLYHRLDRNAEALACYTRAAEFFHATSDQTGLALTTYNRANVLCNLDEFRQAETLYEQAYDLYHANEDELRAVQTRYSLGYLYFLRGAYHQAMRVLHETRAAAAQTNDQRTPPLCLLDLSEIYLQLNLLDEAAQLAVQARAQFLALGMRYEAARAATFLGLAQMRQAKLDEAQNTLAIAHNEFAAEGNAVQLGLIQLYQAEAALAGGAHEQAIELAQTAESCFAEQQLKAKTCAAQIIQARARLSAEQAARPLCEVILQTAEEIEAPWLRAQAYELLGDACLAEHDTTAAHQHFAAAAAFIEQIRCQIRVDEFRSAFFRDKLRVYEKLIRLCLDADDPAQAFYYLESAKARTLVDLLVNELELTPKEDAASADLLAQWRRLREELHWHYSKLSQSETLGQNRRLATDQHLRAEITRCENELAETTRALQAADPAFVWLESSGGMHVAELRALLAADETAIEYYCEGEQLWIFVIERDGLRVQRSPVSYADIKAQLRKLRFQLDKFHYGPAYVAAHATRLQKDAEASLHALWRALIAPVAGYLRGRQLIVIPFGALHNVPFQALFDGQGYLLEDHEITQAPSARLLQLCTNRSINLDGQATIFGVADDHTPHITAEIEAIRALFPTAQCFTGTSATAQALTTTAPVSHLLHVASHGVFRQDNPLFSAFKLSDTWLNLYDIGALRLPAALVTLSGCSTGMSSVYAGDEMMGLARGFLTAGAAALVVSLWSVNDAATAHLMTAFYQRLRDGMTLRAALRQAALLTKTQYAHPYYWSPFVLLSHH